MMNTPPDETRATDPREDNPEGRRGVMALVPAPEGPSDPLRNGWTLVDVRYSYDRSAGHRITPVLSQAPAQDQLTHGEIEAGVLLYKRDSAEGNVQLEDFDTVEELLTEASDRLTTWTGGRPRTDSERFDYYLRAWIQAGRQSGFGREGMVKALLAVLESEWT